MYYLQIILNKKSAAVVAQFVRASPHERKVGCSNPIRHRPKSLKTGSDSCTAKRSAIGVRVTGPRR